jgi:hypothetical protein
VILAAAGERLGVPGGLESITAVTWELVAAGDGAVLRRGPDVIIMPCPQDTIGCDAGGDQTFTTARWGI